MQNDPLYNKVMKKIFIISVLWENNIPSIVNANMLPSEILLPGSLPVVGVVIMSDPDYGATDYMTISQWEIADDGTSVFFTTADGFQIDADIANNTWKVHE